MQLSRLFEQVYLLLDRKGMTADELAEHFEVSRRTIYRDVDTLAQAGIPIYAERGKGGGIRLTEQFVLNKSVLSAEKRRSLLAATDALQERFGDGTVRFGFELRQSGNTTGSSSKNVEDYK